MKILPARLMNATVLTLVTLMAPNDSSFARFIDNEKFKTALKELKKK